MPSLHTIWKGRMPVTKNWECTWHMALSGVGSLWWETFH